MKLPGGGRMPFGQFLKRLYEEYEKDAVSDTAAQLGYYFLFALFPFMGFLFTLAAYLPLQQSVDEALSRVRMLLPGPAMGLIDTHVRSLVTTARPQLLTLGLLLTIWSASRGVDAVRRALNLAYDVKESRPYWKVQLISVGMTLAGAVMVLVAITVLIAGGSVGLWLAQKVGVGSQYTLVASWLRWPLTAFLIMWVAALAYYFLPDVQQEFRFITPGSIVATLLWLAATWGFGHYVSSFGNYNATYGSIGGVVVLLTWLYLSGFIFIMGGEANAVLEHNSQEGKDEGAREKGVPAPPKEQRPSAMPPGATKTASVAEQSPGGASP